MKRETLATIVKEVVAVSVETRTNAYSMKCYGRMYGNLNTCEEEKVTSMKKKQFQTIKRNSEYEKEAITGGTQDDKQLRKWLYNNYGVCDSWLDIVPKVKQELSELSLAEEKLVRKINHGKNNMKKWRVTN